MAGPQRRLRIPNIIQLPNGHVTMGIRSLRSLCLDSIIVNSQGKLFIRGLSKLVEIGLVPDKLSIMMVNRDKFHLQFWLPTVDMHPFTVIFRTLYSLLCGIGYLKQWNVKHIEMINCTFLSNQINGLTNALKKLQPLSVTLLNCQYNSLNQQERFRLSAGLRDNGKIQVIFIGSTMNHEKTLPKAITEKYNNKSMRTMSAAEIRRSQKELDAARRRKERAMALQALTGSTTPKAEANVEAKTTQTTRRKPAASAQPSTSKRSTSGKTGLRRSKRIQVALAANAKRCTCAP